MRVYYRDSEVSVTSLAFWAYGDAYLLRDVEYVWRVRRHALGRRAITAAVVLVIAVGSQVALLLFAPWVGAGSGLVFGTAALLLVRSVARLVGGATALNALENLRRFRRSLELWAIVADAEVLLLATDDALRHGQICRALTRALDERDRRQEMHALQRAARISVAHAEAQ